MKLNRSQNTTDQDDKVIKHLCKDNILPKINVNNDHVKGELSTLENVCAFCDK